MIQDQEYILLPCSGRARLGIPRGHLYRVTNRAGEEQGFATQESAYRAYGKDNCYISGSDSLCEICEADIRGQFEIDLVGRD
jgi:hypothetical protein